MIKYDSDEIALMLGSLRQAAHSFDHRFYGANKALEGILLRAAAALENYHTNIEAAYNTRCSVHAEKLDCIEQKLDVLLEKINTMAQDINALNAGIDGLNTYVTALTTAVNEILAKNAASPQPVDYTEQVNKLNGIGQEVKNNTAHIEETITPAPIVTPEPARPPVDVPLPATAADNTPAAGAAENPGTQTDPAVQLGVQTDTPEKPAA